MKNEDTQLYKISNIETFNKFLLTISSVALGFIYHLIQDGKSWLLGLKMSVVLFAISIILTMLSLIIVADFPKPKACLNLFINIIDWIAFIAFVVAIILICASVFVISSSSHL